MVQFTEQVIQYKVSGAAVSAARRLATQQVYTNSSPYQPNYARVKIILQLGEQCSETYAARELELVHNLMV